MPILMDRERILITGGSGFIGTHLGEALIKTDETFLNVDKSPPKLRAHDKYWKQLDILNVDGLQEAIESFAPTTIINLAANTDISNGGESLKVNYDGVGNLIKCVNITGRSVQLIHFSTQLVIGPDAPMTDVWSYAPYSEYGESKAKSEIILREQGDGLNWVIVRPSTIWGPWHPSFETAIWKYIRRRLYVHAATRDPVRSYGYVGNLISQLINLVSAPISLKFGKVFYLGDEPMRSSIWLDAFSLALTGKPVRRVPFALLYAMALAGELSGKIGGPSPINLGRLYRMTSDYAVSMDSTFALLGRGPFDLNEGVAESMRWLRRDR